MAIAKMNKVTLIAHRPQLDQLLTTIQLQNVMEVKQVNPTGDLGFDSEVIRYFDPYTQEERYNEDALQAIREREAVINFTIKQLEHYVPRQSLLSTLRQEKPHYDYERLLAHDREFKEKEIIEMTQAHLERIKEIDNLIEKRKGQIERYQKWKGLDITPNVSQSMKYIQALIGTVPNVESNQYINLISQSNLVDHEIIYLNDLEYGLVLLYSRSQGKEVADLMVAANFKALDYPYTTLPGLKIEGWNQELNNFKVERQAIMEELSTSQHALEGLKIQLDRVKSLYAYENTKKKIGLTPHLLAIEGWVAEEDLTLFEEACLKNEATEVAYYIHPAEELEIEVDEIPIKLNNNVLVAPFELITKMYALPKYNEVDPTPFLMPFYFVFFGMMVADLGYGLLVFLVCLLGLKLFKGQDNLKSSLRFGMILGIGIMIWGTIYGSFFGFSLPVQLINPNEDVMLVLGISVGLGLIHLFTSLGLNVYLKAKEKNYVEAYSKGLVWILLLTGFLLLGLGSLSPQYAVLATIGKWLAILNAIGVVVASCIQAGGIGGLGWGLYDLYGVTGYVGDLVSYTRLMALGLSGGSIALAFNMIIQFLPEPARWTVGIVLFVLLHALSLFLSLLSAYVHGARLIFVEFFAKFYGGGGRAFNPLKMSEENIQFKHENVRS